MRKSKIAIFTTFLFPLGTPLGQSRYILYGWKENSMLTNCLAACAHPTIIISEIQRDICEKNRHFIIPPLHSTPPLGGSRRNIGTPFGMKKLEWCRYQMWKEFEDMFIRFDVIHERDRRTDGRTLHDSKDRACIASRGKKYHGRKYHGTFYCGIRWCF